MRMFFWREGPVDDCFVVRFDAFRGRHGEGIDAYGTERYLKFNDPAVPSPFGTMVVVDLPLNNSDGVGPGGLGLPGDLRAGDFLSFELNILPDSMIDPDVSFALMGVEFFETHAGSVAVSHATVFETLDDVDCPVVRECRSDRDCDDGNFCNGMETCDGDGQCVAGEFPCADEGQMCDEVDDMCVSCDEPVGTGKVVICHVPDTQPDGAHTLMVGSGAVNGHLDHGDTLGPCGVDCGAP
jgi:hypothetical protein